MRLIARQLLLTIPTIVITTCGQWCLASNCSGQAPGIDSDAQKVPFALSMTSSEQPKVDTSLPVGSVSTREEPAQTFALSGLVHRAGEHTTPDAVVRVPPEFDSTKPIHLVIYNHGWGSNASSCYVENQLSAHMTGAPPNTVLVVPEWQETAAARNGEQGHFKDKNVFRDMLQEIFDKTVPINGKNIDHVDDITIFAHSAGYGPTETEINNNDGISDKVVNITLLDALYDKFGFDQWLQANIQELAAGKKRFYNFFSGTPIYSKAQADRVQEMLQTAGLSKTCMIKDYDNGDKVMAIDSIAKHPIIFKYSSATVGTLGAHMSMPILYIGLVETAENQRTKADK